MHWPTEKCPPPNGPLATEHLDYIQLRANAQLNAGDPLLARINDAIDACRNNNCLPNGPPPDLCKHCTRLLWARCLAADGNWGDCAVELEHGT